jgi:hypothetical protein
MGHLLRFSALLIRVTTQRFFSDVAQELLKKENKNQETISTPRNRVLAYTETARN